jgi:hypothetical protein
VVGMEEDDILHTLRSLRRNRESLRLSVLHVEDLMKEQLKRVDPNRPVDDPLSEVRLARVAGISRTTLRKWLRS